MLSGHVTVQWGRQFETKQDIQTQVQGTDFYNSVSGKYEPVVIVAHWQYDDYKLEFYKVVAGTLPAKLPPSSGWQRVGGYLFNLPPPPGTSRERSLPSNTFPSASR